MTTQSNATTTAASPWEQANLFINGMKVEWGAKPVFIRGQVNDVTVEAPREIAEELNLGLVEYGDLNIVASPDFGSWVAPVNRRFDWKISPGAGKSGRITLVFFSREVPVPWEQRSLVISSNLAEEVTVLLNGNAMPLRGANFIGGQTNVLTLEYKNADLLVGLPLAIDVSPQSGVVFNDFICVPRLLQLTAKHEWKLTTASPLKPGTFKLKFSNEGETSSLFTPTNRLSHEIFRFLDLVNHEMVLPPEDVGLVANIPYVFRARLLNAAGSPVASVPVTFTVPEHEVFDTETDSDGIAYSNLCSFKTAGMRKVSALANLSTGNSWLELQVRISGGES